MAIESLKVNFKTGGELSKPVNSMSYSELQSYISKKYLPKLESVLMTFSIRGGGFDYDLVNSKSKGSLLNYYKDQSDYTEEELDDRTNYKVENWAVLRKEIDDETDELVFEKKLILDSEDNTHNFEYLGLLDLNIRYYFDSDYNKWFAIIHPHISGDIRGEYSNGLILEGDSYDELEEKFENKFISGKAFLNFIFSDRSYISFESEQDRDIFSFKLAKSNELKRGTLAYELYEDFDSILDKSKSDSFLETIVEIYNKNHSVAIKKDGGNVSSENPMFYVRVEETGVGKWFDLTEYINGDDVINAISEYLQEINDSNARLDYEISDWKGFGKRYYSKNMGEENFDSVLEAWDNFKYSDFPIQVIEEYMNDTNNNDMEDAIKSMSDTFFGSFNSYESLGRKIVEVGNYKPTIDEVYINDSDRRKLSQKETNELVSKMTDSEILLYSDMDEDYQDLEIGISVIKDEIKKINSINDDISNDIIDLESQIDNNDEDGIEVITDLLVEKKEELENNNSKINTLKNNIKNSEKQMKSILSMAKDISSSEIKENLSRKLENNLSDFVGDEITPELLSEKPFLALDYDKIGRSNIDNFLVIENDEMGLNSENDSLFVFENYSNGGKVLSTLKPSKKYNYFVIELGSKRVVFGSENRDKADQKQKELADDFKKLKFNVYKRDYSERRLGIDVDNTMNWIDSSDIKNESRVAVKKISKKSLGGWLKKQWVEADFGDGIGKTRFFAKGGKIPSYWGSGENIHVFDYKTEYFDMCGGASKMFQKVIDEINGIGEDSKTELYSLGIYTKEKDIQDIVISAKFLDDFFMIDKEIIQKNKATKNEIQKAISNLLQSQIFFGKVNLFDTFDFAVPHIVEMVKRLDKSELNFSDGGKVIYDHEGDMAKSELQKIEKYAKYLDENIDTDTKLMAWVQSKISRMATDMGDVKHYMEYQLNNKKALGGLVIGGIAVLVGALTLYFINKNKRNIKGGNHLHTRLGWVQDQRKRSKQEHEIQYQKKKLKK